MKAISLWQPWASLWVAGAKVHETRHWPTKVRGWVLVHAAKKLVSECGELVDGLCIDRFGPHWRRTMPRGALVGAVKLEHCQPCDEVLRTFLAREQPSNFVCGDFADGRYAWRRELFTAAHFDQPIAYRGRQGFFEVDEHEDLGMGAREQLYLAGAI